MYKHELCKNWNIIRSYIYSIGRGHLPPTKFKVWGHTPTIILQGIAWPSRYYTHKLTLQQSGRLRSSPHPQNLAEQKKKNNNNNNNNNKKHGGFLISWKGPYHHKLETPGFPKYQDPGPLFGLLGTKPRLPMVPAIKRFHCICKVLQCKKLVAGIQGKYVLL